MQRNRLIEGALVALYLAAIVTANVLVSRFGVEVIFYNAFALIGLDLITRDRLADFWQGKRLVKQGALILAGTALSYVASPEAAKVAVASGAAFFAAESCEALLYYALRRRQWLERANISAMLGAAVDSIVFPTLAFGVFVFSTSFTLFAVKLAGAFVWSLVIGRVRLNRAAA